MQMNLFNWKRMYKKKDMAPKKDMAAESLLSASETPCSSGEVLTYPVRSFISVLYIYIM